MVRKDYRAFYKATEESFMLGPDLSCTDGCFIPRFLFITLTHCSVCNSNKLIGSPQWAWWHLMVCHWILEGEGGLCLLKKRNFSHTSQLPLLSHFSFPFSPGALVSSGSLYLFHLRPWPWPIPAKQERCAGPSDFFTALFADFSSRSLFLFCFPGCPIYLSDISLHICTFTPLPGVTSFSIWINRKVQVWTYKV